MPMKCTLSCATSFDPRASEAPIPPGCARRAARRDAHRRGRAGWPRRRSAGARARRGAADPQVSAICAAVAATARAVRGQTSRPPQGAIPGRSGLGTARRRTGPAVVRRVGPVHLSHAHATVCPRHDTQRFEQSPTHHALCCTDNLPNRARGLRANAGHVA